MKRNTRLVNGSARSQGLRLLRAAAVLGCVASLTGRAAVSHASDAAVPSGNLGLLDVSREVLRGQRPMVFRGMGPAGFSIVTPPGELAAQPHLDLSPLLDGIFGFLNHHGVPLHPQNDENGDGPIGVYADFSVGHNMAPVSFHLGDRPMERIGAFYSNDHGFRCAVSYPIQHFTLRLEGGEDSELGYYGIAGLQWLDPRRPLAIGVGVPMNLRGIERGIGVVVQLRMSLN